MIMCVLLCYPVSIHMSQLLSTGHPISSCKLKSHTRLLSPSYNVFTVVQIYHCRYESRSYF